MPIVIEDFETSLIGTIMRTAAGLTVVLRKADFHSACVWCEHYDCEMYRIAPVETPDNMFLRPECLIRKYRDPDLNR